MCPPNTPKRSSESQASKLVAISFLAFRLPTRCGTRCDYILYFADHQNLRSIVNNYRKVRIPLIRWPEPSFVTVPYLTFDYYLITASLALQVRSHSTSATLLHLRPLAFLQRLFLAATSPDYHRTPPLARVFLQFFENL